MPTSDKQDTLMREAKWVQAAGVEPTPEQKKMLRTKRQEAQRAW